MKTNSPSIDKTQREVSRAIGSVLYRMGEKHLNYEIALNSAEESITDLVTQARQEERLKIIDMAEQVLLQKEGKPTVGDCGTPHCSHQLSLFIKTLKNYNLTNP